MCSGFSDDPSTLCHCGSKNLFPAQGSHKLPWHSSSNLLNAIIEFIETHLVRPIPRHKKYWFVENDMKLNHHHIPLNERS